jgi:hypothetical protein
MRPLRRGTTGAWIALDALGEIRKAIFGSPPEVVRRRRYHCYFLPEASLDLRSATRCSYSA